MWREGWLPGSREYIDASGTCIGSCLGGGNRYLGDKRRRRYSYYPENSFVLKVMYLPREGLCSSVFNETERNGDYARIQCVSHQIFHLAESIGLSRECKIRYQSYMDMKNTVWGIILMVLLIVGSIGGCSLVSWFSVDGVRLVR